MDVVGVDIVGGGQRRQALFQAFERQTVGGINARGTQDGDTHAVVPPPGTQAAFGIDAALGAAAFRLQTTGLVDDLAAAIAVDPGRTNVDQAAW